MKIRSTKFEIRNKSQIVKHKCLNDQNISKSFNKGFNVPKAFVLNFVFWLFEFVSNFDIRISNLLYVIYGRSLRGGLIFTARRG
jgi:hypothetical protein